MTPHLKCCAQLWGHQHKDVNLLEQVQRKVIKIIKGLEHLSLERVGTVQPREEKTLGKPYSKLAGHKGGLQERQRGTFYKVMKC